MHEGKIRDMLANSRRPRMGRSEECNEGYDRETISEFYSVLDVKDISDEIGVVLVSLFPGINTSGIGH